jgi:hypothetical protein
MPIRIMAAAAEARGRASKIIAAPNALSIRRRAIFTLGSGILFSPGIAFSVPLAGKSQPYAAPGAPTIAAARRSEPENQSHLKKNAL